VKFVAINKNNKDTIKKKEKTSAITLVALPLENEINKAVTK
jgi:hypothetical protein